MDWSVILDGFVLLAQVACVAFLAYSAWLCVSAAWAGDEVEHGPRPAVTDPADVEAVEALAEWAHIERSHVLGRFLARLPVEAWRLACQGVDRVLGRGATRLVR